MVVRTDAEADVDRLFQALADRTRRDILSEVMARGRSVSDLAGRYEMSFAAVQKHVAVLASASLVTKQRRGREQIVNGDARAVECAQHLLTEYEKIWRDRADRIGDLLSENAPPMEGTP